MSTASLDIVNLGGETGLQKLGGLGSYSLTSSMFPFEIFLFLSLSLSLYFALVLCSLSHIESH